jgi:hypothetical protein
LRHQRERLLLYCICTVLLHLTSFACSGGRVHPRWVQEFDEELKRGLAGEAESRRMAAHLQECTDGYNTSRKTLNRARLVCPLHSPVPHIFESRW